MIGNRSSWSSLPQDSTRLLERARQGDESAADEVYRGMHGVLRELAVKRMRNRGCQAVWQPTMFVHDALVKLLDLRRARWRDRRQFFAMAARVIRDLVTDFRRRHGAQKRGGDRPHDEIEVEAAPAAAVDLDLAQDVDGALERLASVRPRLAEVVHLRFRRGLSIAETAAVLGVGHSTVEGEWQLARTLLHEMFER